MSALRPVLFDDEYGFASLDRLPQGFEPLATFRETEGLSVVATCAAFAEANVLPQRGFARISLALESALDGVGLTAAIAGALADAGIACNVIAAFHHDHVFVPWKRREDAVRIIETLENPL